MADLLNRPESSFARKLAGYKGGWTATDYLLAMLVDEQRVADWHFVAANTRKGKSPPEPPKPVLRPGQVPKTNPRLDPKEAHDRLVARHRELAQEGAVRAPWH